MDVLSRRGRPFVMALIGVLRPFLEDVKAHGGLKRMLTDFGRPRLRISDLSTSS